MRSLFLGRCRGARPCLAAITSSATSSSPLCSLLRGAAPPPARASCRGHASSTRGEVFFQSSNVPTSLTSTGLVGTVRDGTGSDGSFFGVDPVATEVDVFDGRSRDLTLDKNGFALVKHPLDHVDYYNNSEVLHGYYPEVERLVLQETGAEFAVAFDHNIRAKSRKESGQHLSGGGNLVQEPLITYGVHNDYTAVSAQARIRQLAETPKHNDTLRPKLGAQPAIDPARLDSLLNRRWAFINVWRNITEQPVERYPLALLDATSVRTEDLVVFEIRYSDRTGENYFARESPDNRWYYFPKATRDEAILLKCWDSRGKDFIDMMPGDAISKQDSVPATFSLHTGFFDRSTPSSAPDRESIEIRVVAFF